MSRLRRARIACIVSIVWSAIFIVIEVATKAYIYALVQFGLLVAGVALLVIHTRLIAKSQTSLPPPASSNASIPSEH